VVTDAPNFILKRSESKITRRSSRISRKRRMSRVHVFFWRANHALLAGQCSMDGRPQEMSLQGLATFSFVLHATTPTVWQRADLLWGALRLNPIKLVLSPIVRGRQAPVLGAFNFWPTKLVPQQTLPGSLTATQNSLFYRVFTRSSKRPANFQQMYSKYM